MCPKCLIVAGLMSEVGADLPATLDCSPSEILRMAQGAAPKTIAPSVLQAPTFPRMFGGYRIVRPLGKGGMGTVYEAEEQASGRRLALKVLSHSLDSEQARTRFFREGRLAASVNHPNSVYVFGTEEIDGMPVITMELAAGGTLQEMVKRKGPLPIAEAVDIILQIIAGLEAAAAGGVLHRDVKPSNCFIDADGTVKVGDFGLSISTLARRETQLTTTGAVLGTPAYASPEQLRGDEIDSRSDIYAVGVTFYYLLTARVPFTDDNMVRLLATVLERPAESPRKLRGEIPEELGKVILRCLAKQPAQRFRNYEELRLALLPFTSTAPVPAGLGLRFLAFFLDGMLALAVVMAGVMASITRITAAANGITVRGVMWFGISFYLIPILIFVIPEWLWGATLGKAMLGLRVVGLKRKSPGVFRALLRSVIVIAAFALGGLVQGIFVRVTGNPQSPRMWFAIFAPYQCMLLLFVTARRRNGYAALQDLISGTRVIVKPDWQRRSATAAPPAPEPATEGTPRVGPYHVLAELGGPESCEFFVGYDARLFRKVWIRQLPPDAAEVSPAQRMLTRQGRLRWLAGQRAPGENWDAYEAPTGQPLTALLHQRQSWKHVRYWLADLAAEVEAAARDQTLPATLGLDRIWITDDGRAKLLDFPAPAAAASLDGERNSNIAIHVPETHLPFTDRDAQLFLKLLAISALEGRPAAGVRLIDYTPRIPMPLHARSLVTRIGAFPGIDALTVELGKTRNLPAEISTARRLVLLAGCVLPALMVIVLGAITLWTGMRAMGKGSSEFRQFVELKMCLEKLPSLRKERHTDGLDEAMEVYIAGRFKDLVTNPTAWNNNMYIAILTMEQRRLAESIVTSRATVPEKEFNEASKRVKPLGVDFGGVSKRVNGIDVSEIESMNEIVPRAAMMGTMMWAIYTGVPALIAAALFRGGLLLHGLGLVVVTRDGTPARRWRVVCRGMIVWLPAILASTLLLPLPTWLGSSLFITMLCAYVGAALWSLRNPECGVQDFLARTRMVPR
jgi:hypothetical protein